MNRFRALLVALLMSSAAAQAGTYTAVSCRQSDVNALINGPTHTAVDGDVINIPAGTCTWASGISVPSNIGITIAGAGTPNSSAATTGPSASCTQTAITISSGMALTIRPTFGNSTARVSCMSLTRGGSSSGVAFLGTCSSSGCPNVRMDNITFSGWVGNSGAGNAYGVNAASDSFGVLDHNLLTGGSDYTQLVEVGHGSYLGVGQYGDNSWHLPENYGSANFLFIENNIINSANCCENESGIIEGFRTGDNGGGRVVVRYNQFTDGANFSNGAFFWHGTESSGRTRSGRAFEFYGNTYTCPSGANCNDVTSPRGGTGIVWGNTVNRSSASLNTLLNLQYYRAFADPNPAFGVCDGANVYDKNDGITYCDGTISGSVGGSQGAYTVPVSCSTSGSVPSNPPAGSPYSLHDISQINGGEITNISGGVLTVNSGWGQVGTWTPHNGDHIQILRASACVDQTGGRGAGVLYGATNPATPAVSSAQALSPVYVWSNTINGGAITLVDPVTSRVIRNRDYYNETTNQGAQTSLSSPFDGTTTIGLGHGTLANRPTACTAGVGYWATDQGNWNQSGSGGQGRLYVCTATNTWTLYYTPYTYPNPLVAPPSSTTPAAPTGLQAVVQ